MALGNSPQFPWQYWVTSGVTQTTMLTQTTTDMVTLNCRPWSLPFLRCGLHGYVQAFPRQESPPVLNHESLVTHV